MRFPGPPDAASFFEHFVGVDSARGSIPESPRSYDSRGVARRQRRLRWLLLFQRYPMYRTHRRQPLLGISRSKAVPTPPRRGTFEHVDGDDVPVIAVASSDDEPQDGQAGARFRPGSALATRQTHPRSFRIPLQYRGANRKFPAGSRPGRSHIASRNRRGSNRAACMAWLLGPKHPK